jgi:hypothetical protein
MLNGFYNVVGYLQQQKACYEVFATCHAMPCLGSYPLHTSLFRHLFEPSHS